MCVFPLPLLPSLPFPPSLLTLCRLCAPRRAIDAGHQLAEVRVFAQTLPVRVRLEPGLVLVTQLDRRLQPTEGFVPFAEHRVRARDPVGHVEVRAAHAQCAFRQLRARAFPVARARGELREQGPHAFRVGVAAKGLAHRAQSAFEVAAPRAYDRAERAYERVVRLDRKSTR